MSVAVLADMVREAEKHADDLSKDRIRAVEYYQGIMRDTPSDKGRSQMVSRDVRAVIKKVLPSIVRTILGNEQIAEYQPVGMGDEEGAEQATDYINHIVLPECDGYKVIEDAIHDALLLRNGIIHACFEEKRDVRVSEHTGLPDDAFAMLVAEPDVEVLEHTAREEMTELGPMAVHDVKIKRFVTSRNIKASAVPRERFLIHPDAVSLEDSALTGAKTQVRRSDLVAMGYDKDLVWGLSEGDEDDDFERDTRRDSVTDTDETHRANELVDYYDLYVRFDQDDDGIAELRHVCFAGGLGENNLLLNEEADEVQYYDVKVLSQPHQWEGISLFDDTADIQRAKTVLLRQTLDNLYWQNNPQPLVQEDAIKNLDAVFNPEFGLPIRVKTGVDVRAAYGFNQVPMVADKSFAMLEYMDQEAQERTGITDASSGLAPDALQNMTAKASAMIEQAGIGQTELMVRTIAEGLRRFFRGLLKLVVKHQDAPRTVRLRVQWVQMAPRSWNSDMDCTVNTGLGAGTRERDMQVMQFVMGMQEKIIAGFGPDNPFVKPENLYQSLEQLIRAAGLKSPGLYFTEPNPEEIAAKMQAAQQQPSPEMMKVQAQAEAEKAKIELQGKAKAAEIQADTEAQRQRIAAEMQIQREKMQAELELSRERMMAEMQLKREQMAMEAEMRAAMNATANVGGSVQFGGAVG